MPVLVIVEDNVIFANSLVRFLRKQGNLTVAVAPTAEAALEQLPDLVVDLVLVELALPVMNGIDPVATLHEQYPAMPCLILSGHNSSEYAERALAAD